MVLGGVVGLRAYAAGQGASAPLQLHVLAPAEPLPSLQPTPFVGTTIFVSTSGSDTNAGTQSSPVQTINRGVALANVVHASGQPARVLIANGVYRESVDLGGQKTEAAMVIHGGGPNTVLTGADDWSTGWTAQEDGSFVHSWPNKWGMKPVPPAWEFYWKSLQDPQKDTLRRTETVFFNGVPLMPRISLATMTGPGQFFVDEATSRLYIRLPAGASMNNALIEVGSRVTVLKVNGRRNVTVEQLSIARSRGGVQDVMVSITNSKNITLDSVVISNAAHGAIGSATTSGLKILRSALNDNGVNGYSDYHNRFVTIEDSEVARNNWRGYAVGHQGWDSVFKIFGDRDVVVRHVQFVDNMGSGFWADSNNQRVTVEQSLMKGNVGKGVSLEKNDGPIALIGNRVCNNVEGGIVDAQSDNVTLENNQIFNNTNFNVAFSGVYAGQTFTNWETGTSYTARSWYWTVSGNTIVGSGVGTGPTNAGWLWWHTDYLASGAWASIRNTMQLMNNNVWFHTSRPDAFRLPQGAVPFRGFASDLQQSNPVFESQSGWTLPALICALP